jgi:hypothetical protein
MIDESKQQLAYFQSRLAEGKPAQVCPLIGVNIFWAIQHIHFWTNRDFSRRAGIREGTMSKYVLGQRSPGFNRFVYLMDRLGYEVYIKPKDSASGSTDKP